MIQGAGSPRLYTPADLAELFGISERSLMDWRRQYGWPSVRVGRTIRFTQAHVDQILASHSQAAPLVSDAVDALPGQSKASAARKRAS